MNDFFVEVIIVGAANPRPMLFRVGAIDRVAPVIGSNEGRTLLVSSGVTYSLRDEYEDVKRKLESASRASTKQEVAG
jgi:hypothetical protein